MIHQQIDTNLLAANELNIELITRQTALLLARAVDFCDFYIQVTANESFSLDEGIIKVADFAINQGIGLRAICHEKTFLTYATSITPVTLNDLVNNIFIESSAANNIAVKSTAQARHAITSLYSFGNPIHSTDTACKIALLKTIDQKARQLPYVSNVIVNLSLEYDQICIVRSDERNASDIRPLIHLSIAIFINKNGNIERASSGGGGRYGDLALYNEEFIEHHINKAYQLALLKVDALPSPSGNMPVVLGSGFAGVLLHEAVGHGLEGDFNRRGSSAFSNKIGQKVANAGVTVIDDGTINNRRGSLNIDDEGNATACNVLIENGVLRGYLFDELNAKLMGVKSTGNGRRESFACNPMPRMTNTYMQGNGEFSHEEIISSVKDGLYAESFEGGQVDITSGQFVFNASNAWVIKNGRLSHPVKGCALIGNGPECLNFVTMIGNDMQLDSGVGVCGKEGQSVPVGVGQPTVKIEGGIIVGGSTL